MKKLFRTTLCAALLAALACLPAFAAQDTGAALPEKQGAFYVLANGEYVTFTDAVPQIRNDRSCLPFVAVFDQLGFAEENMTWDGATRTVTAAKDELTIALTIDKSEIVLTEKGETKTIPTDVAPYIDAATSRTYVPFGLVAEALGYNVGWDAELGAVIIDDVDAILAANTATYTQMERYMEYARSFNEKDQQVTGKYGMNISVKADSTDVGVKADGNYDMTASGSSAFQFTTDMKIDVTATEDGKDITGTLTEEAEIQLPLTVDLEMRGDLEKGVLYFQSAALAQAMEQPGLANAWYKMDLTEMFDAIGLDMDELLKLAADAQKMKFEDALALALRMFHSTDAGYTASDFLADMNKMFADSAFTKSGSNYVSTFTEDGVTFIFTLYTSGDKVNGYAMQVSGTAPEVGGMEMTASMRGSKLEMKMAMDADMGPAEAISLSMTMDGTYRASTSAPATEPPADAVIMDLAGSL